MYFSIFYPVFDKYFLEKLEVNFCNDAGDRWTNGYASSGLKLFIIIMNIILI